LPHVERDPEVEPERTLCDGGASLMQAWSEDGTALVRGRGILSRNTFIENVNKNQDDTPYKNKKGDLPLTTLSIWKSYDYIIPKKKSIRLR
jgi:hypothetical protein